jgi:hypothetical protein
MLSIFKLNFNRLPIDDALQKRASKVTVAFIQFYQPAAWFLSVGDHQLRLPISFNRIVTNLSNYQWNKSLSNGLELSYSIAYLAAHLFNHRPSLTIIYTIDISNNIFTINRFIDETERNLKDWVVSTRCSLSLISLFSNNRYLSILSSTLQMILECNRAWKQWERSRPYECSAWILISGLRFSQITL